MTNAQADALTLREIEALPGGRETIWWATENLRRARAIDRLILAGKIDVDSSGGYPRLKITRL